MSIFWLTHANLKYLFCARYASSSSLSSSSHRYYSIRPFATSAASFLPPPPPRYISRCNKDNGVYALPLVGAILLFASTRHDRILHFPHHLCMSSNPHLKSASLLSIPKQNGYMQSQEYTNLNSFISSRNNTFLLPKHLRV